MDLTLNFEIFDHTHRARKRGPRYQDRARKRGPRYHDRARKCGPRYQDRARKWYQVPGGPHKLDQQCYPAGRLLMLKPQQPLEVVQQAKRQRDRVDQKLFRQAQRLG
jgi:hypothetical protein